MGSEEEEEEEEKGKLAKRRRRRRRKTRWRIHVNEQNLDLFHNTTADSPILLINYKTSWLK